MVRVVLNKNTFSITTYATLVFTILFAVILILSNDKPQTNTRLACVIKEKYHFSISNDIIKFYATGDVSMDNLERIN